MKKRTISFLLLFAICFVFATGTAGAIFLDKGMKGSEVEKLQRMLYSLGYKIEIDGIYGPMTEKVIKDLQSKNGLGVDGITGPRTYELIKNLVQKSLYRVGKGDTLSEIALKFGTKINDLKKVNNLKGDKIIVGQKLIIPGSLSRGGRERRTGFIWPVRGKITSPYAWRIHPIKKVRHFHEGIDIAAKEGTPIKAAKGGQVFFSGWAQGFGWTLIIDHGQGIRTLYGHCSTLLVKRGERVSAGQIIARVGSTGMSTGPHLDFRIYVDGKTVNPVKYLP